MKSPFELSAGEFQLRDKLQPQTYIESRADTLRRLYNVDPQLAIDVVSSVYPHKFKRPWLDQELRERLSLPPMAAAAEDALQSKTASEFLASTFPSLSAAFNAYDASRAEQQAVQAARDAIAFPALHATQPQMYMAQQYMMGGGTPSAPTTTHHHRRHRHHG